MSKIKEIEIKLYKTTRFDGDTEKPFWRCDIILKDHSCHGISYDNAMLALSTAMAHWQYYTYGSDKGGIRSEGII